MARKRKCILRVLLGAIILSFVAGVVSLPAQGALPDPKTHLKHYPLLDDYFTFGVYNVGTNGYYLPWMKEHLGLTAPELFDLQVRVVAANGINTIISDARTGHALAATREYGVGFLAEMLYWYNMPFEECKRNWVEYVKQTKDAPNILGWYVYDEPLGGEDMILKYIELKNALYAADKAHPAVEITSGVHPALARHMEYYMWDDYPFWAMAFSGGNIRELRENARRASASAPFINVAVIQGAHEGTYPLSPVEVRAQTYIVLANGANGVMYYHGGFRHPAWRKWTPEDKYCGIGSIRHSTLSPVFGYETDRLKEIGRLGGFLVPVGYLLVGAEFVPRTESECVVKCRSVSTHKSEADANGVYRHLPRDIPAVEVGVWRKGDARVLIPYSNNRDMPEKASVRMLNIPNGAKLYNLWTLKEVALRNGSFEVELDNGDGRFYLLATPGVFQREKLKILKRKSEMESRRLKIRMDLARPCGLLDLRPVDALVAEARRSGESGDYEKAVPLMQRAVKSFHSAQKASAGYALVSDSIELCRRTLFEMDEWLGYRVPMLLAVDQRNGADKSRYDAPLGTGLPKLESILAGIREENAKFLPIMKAFETGEMAGIKEKVQDLARRLQALRARLENYRAENGPNVRLGFLALTHGDEPLFDKDAWAFIRLTLPRVEKVCLTEDGSFTDADGKLVNLRDYDALWLHYVTPAGQGFLDKGRKIAVPQALLEGKTIDAFKAYLAAGRGMLLSGLATAYVDDLGLESIEPNVIELNAKGFMGELISRAAAIYSQLHGFSAVKAQAVHPVFRGLQTDGQFFRGESPGYRRNRASWEFPAIPERGNVLACFDARCSAVPRKRYLDLVEFPAGKGRVLACGLPSMVFDTYFNHRGGRYDRFKDLQTFVANMAGYLGDLERPSFVRQPLTGPFCHRDMAKTQTNPRLKWQVSSGSNGGGMYSTDRKLMWGTTENNAWTECQFGKPAVIDRVCVVSFWNGSQWDVAHLRLKVRDEKTGQFIDVVPEAVFDGTLVWETARFSFAPVRTSAIRLEDIRRAQPKPTTKDRTPPSPPIGIHNVVVFGEGRPIETRGK